MASRCPPFLKGIQIKAPFPYFGGSSAIADVVWNALGDVQHYIEPFAGSLAVLLARPLWHNGNIETVNDADCLLANVWRGLQFDPDGCAKWADWPVNHIDLCARKKWLIENRERIREGLGADPKWHDCEAAGYWIWAASCWIGSGMTRPNQIPNISNGGTGIHALGQIPHISDGGKGEPFNTNIYAHFRRLQERLRYVRVVCGDWTQVSGGDWQTNTGLCGYFADPPYSIEDSEHYANAMVDRKKVLSECAIVLRPGGYVVWIDQALPVFANEELLEGRRNEGRMIDETFIIQTISSQKR